MLVRRIALLALALAVACGAATTAAEPRPDFNWSAWQALPVYPQDPKHPDRGRRMPLDTFARQQVETICGKENPKLGLKDFLPVKEYERLVKEKSPALDLFPEGETRKFTAIELLYSWLVEPEKWEDVPFLLAEHQELREEILEVPFQRPEDDKHLKYVSPSHVENCDLLRDRLAELSQQQRMQESAGEKFELSGVDKKVGELANIFQLYKQLTFDPLLDGGARVSLRDEAQTTFEVWQQLDGRGLDLFADAAQETGLAPAISSTRDGLMQLASLLEQPSLGLREAEESILPLSKSADQLAEMFGQFERKFRQAGAPGDFDAEQAAGAKQLLGQLAANSLKLRASVRRLHAALYENDEALRVVPALRADALSEERDPMNAVQPWLDLQTLLFAADPILADYPQAELKDVRDAFDRARLAYADGRANDFASFSEQFSTAMAALAEEIEPQRQELAGADPDLLAYTEYPDPDYTSAEVRYNLFSPFTWSWIISVAALVCFCLAFGALTRPMFWAGVAIMLGGLAWAAFGFYLRVSITRWAPVTNMYETVIYVPFFVSLLGLWFALLPMLWPGVKAAWQATAIPGTWEAARPAEGSPLQFSLGNLMLLVPRVALMIFIFYQLTITPYQAGGRNIINLFPVVDEGASLPNWNNLLTWGVGLLVLLPSIWYLPRVALTALASLGTIPAQLAGKTAEIMPQVYSRRPFVGAATAVGAFFWMIASYAPVLDSSFSPLQPVLRDNFWLTIHVLTIVSSYGAGLLAWGLGNIALFFYLFGEYRDPLPASDLPAGHRPLGDVSSPSLARRPPEECGVLASYVYKSVQVAVLLLAAGTILGGLWADVSWGRFWGWDPKEVWALISLLVYLAILHGRYAGLFGNFGLAVGSVLGACAISFSWYGVNFVLGAGLHSYGFGEGGQWEVGLTAAANLAFTLLAGLRYYSQTAARHVAPVETETEASLTA